MFFLEQNHEHSAILDIYILCRICRVILQQGYNFFGESVSILFHDKSEILLVLGTLFISSTILNNM